ncbi:2,3-diaminopropionate biosynthesis protein SbnA [Mesorhizobium sp. M0698]|uniref:2,3-diaminopropionate biosynthesis protein SbnA n=1 Tax=Mesorhizobium sp. M0698 TaxID=2956987 RepID=UPI00333C606D
MSNQPFFSGVARSILDLVPPNLFFTLENIVRAPVIVKCEGLNAAGSVKMKAAIRIVDDLERAGTLTSGSTLVESSSGNLGIALSMIAAARGYRFICVSDANTASSSIKTMRALGAEVIVVTTKDANGGYLGARIELIKTMCAEDPSKVWVNQYANASNWKAHYDITGPEILSCFPKIDWLVIGAGTTGTLMGCARYFHRNSPLTRIVAVDAKGSVTFGTPPARRLIPGLGTSRCPEITDPTLPSEVIHIDETETISMCRALARQGILVGGSTGTVLAGIARIGDRIAETSTVVTISPDLGSKYLDTIFDDQWVEQNFPGLQASKSLQA